MKKCEWTCGMSATLMIAHNYCASMRAKCARDSGLRCRNVASLRHPPPLPRRQSSLRRSLRTHALRAGTSRSLSTRRPTRRLLGRLQSRPRQPWKRSLSTRRPTRRLLGRLQSRPRQAWKRKSMPPSQAGIPSYPCPSRRTDQKAACTRSRPGALGASSTRQHSPRSPSTRGRTGGREARRLTWPSASRDNGADSQKRMTTKTHLAPLTARPLRVETASHN